MSAIVVRTRMPTLTAPDCGGTGPLAAICAGLVRLARRRGVGEILRLEERHLAGFGLSKSEMLRRAARQAPQAGPSSPTAPATTTT
jgi:hypothetical protein